MFSEQDLARFRVGYDAFLRILETEEDTCAGCYGRKIPGDDGSWVHADSKSTKCYDDAHNE